MKKHLLPLKILNYGFVGGLFLLAACAGPQSARDRLSLELADNDIAKVLPRNEVASVLASGFYGISELSLTPVSVRSLALEGLRGLATIDPEIGIEDSDALIKVKYGDAYIASIISPLEYDSESWSDAVYEALQALWPYSADLALSKPERVYEAVFDAGLSNLDIFSRYAGKIEAESHRDRREGYGGVDMTLKKIDERFIVDRVGREGPAYIGGVRKGDVLIRVDGEAVISKALHDVDTLLRGNVQTELSVEVERPSTGVAQKLFLWRELVIPQSVWVSFDDGVLDVRISSFNERTMSNLSQDIQDSILMHGKALKGVVLDLRGNPGGLLKRAVQVADLFLAGGRIISTQGRHPDSFETYEADKIDVSEGRPLVILLNGRSASASEIVAAALQDRGRAVVVGSSSFGKGTVQSVQHLPNEGEITVTWSRLIAPSGYAFHGLGVRPSVCTSGIKDSLERGPALSEGEGISLMKRWRNVAIEDQEGRKELRSTCPPDLSNKGIDMEIARNIILDASIYKRFNGFTTIATVAQ